MDQHTRRQFLARGAAAGIVVAAVPVVRTFDIPAFGQAGSPPCHNPNDPACAPPGVLSGGANNFPGGAPGGPPGPAVEARQGSPANAPGNVSAATGDRLPFTGSDVRGLAALGAAAAALGTGLVRWSRRDGPGPIGGAGGSALAEPTLTGAALGAATLGATGAHVLWAHETPVHAPLGLPFVVRVTDRHLGAHVDELLASLPAPAVAGDASSPHVFALRDRGVGHHPRYEVGLDGRLLSTADEPWLAVSALLSGIDRAVVAHAAPDALVVHAAAAELGAAAALLVGPSGSGKTTLVAGLARRGFQYLGDEVASVDPVSLRVAPYPKALSLKAGSRTLFAEYDRFEAGPAGEADSPQWNLPPGRIRPDVVGEPVPVRCVVGVHHQRGAPTTLEPLSESDTLALLVEHAFNGDRLGARGFETAGALARSARGFRLVYDDLEQACVRVREALLRSLGSGLV